jgi:AcrR family transcriptional regulator
MARRSTHTPEELRQRILDAAQSIIERDGLIGLSAREIARAIGYSPGTLYNIFENLDDILLTLQTQMVGNLFETMRDVVAKSPPAAGPQSVIDSLARRYLEYALDNKRMWNLLFTHYLPEGMTAPLALHDNINAVSCIVADLLAKLLPGAPRQELEIAAKSLWAGVHGITAIAVTDKGPTMTSATALVFVNQLTTTYTRGLVARAADKKTT